MGYCSRSNSWPLWLNICSTSVDKLGGCVFVVVVVAKRSARERYVTHHAFVTCNRASIHVWFSTLFGMPSNDVNMNEYYLHQAIQLSLRCPSPQASGQVQYWQQVVAASRAAQSAAFQVPGPTSGPSLPAFGGASPAPAAAPVVPPIPLQTGQQMPATSSVYQGPHAYPHTTGDHKQGGRMYAGCSSTVGGAGSQDLQVK